MNDGFAPYVGHSASHASPLEADIDSAHTTVKMRRQREIGGRWLEAST